VKDDPVVCVPESAVAVPAVSTGDVPAVLLTVTFSKPQPSNTVAAVTDGPPDWLASADISFADVVSLWTKNPTKIVRATRSQNSCFFINNLLR
jgi:hypothetical protein